MPPEQIIQRRRLSDDVRHRLLEMIESGHCHGQRGLAARIDDSLPSGPLPRHEDITLADHQEIYERVAERDADGAERAMIDHLTRANVRGRRRSNTKTRRLSGTVTRRLSLNPRRKL